MQIGVAEENQNFGLDEVLNGSQRVEKALQRHSELIVTN